MPGTSGVPGIPRVLEVLYGRHNFRTGKRQHLMNDGKVVTDMTLLQYDLVYVRTPDGFYKVLKARQGRMKEKYDYASFIQLCKLNHVKLADPRRNEHSVDDS